MTYFADLTLYAYIRPEENVKNIGWLDADAPFSNGETAQDFRDALAVLVKHPVHLTRGVHHCPFCRKALGNGEIRVCGIDGDVYAAPMLVHHYVMEHNYKPPDAFIVAAIYSAQKAADNIKP